MLEDVASENAESRGDPDLPLIVYGTYTVVGHETWRDVLVESGSRLFVTDGAILETTFIQLEGTSILEVRSSALVLTNGSHCAKVGIFGECNRFSIHKGSTVTIQGPNGSYDLPTSMGVPAGINVTSQSKVIIVGSSIFITGGDGLSPSEPMTIWDLEADEFSGGDAELNIQVLSTRPLIDIRVSTIRIEGGNGGKAPDGQEPLGFHDGGNGGGYTRGGDVSGRVGGGGDAYLSLSSAGININRSQIALVGGDGGDAGDGGGTRGNGTYGGGGGGGYSGGDGGSGRYTWNEAIPGGDVSGDVGAGGDAGFRVHGTSVSIDLSTIHATGGNGGNAGHGAPTTSLAGGGGGGYAGGGGGTVSSPGGDGGTITGHVAKGGDAVIDLTQQIYLSSYVTDLAVQGGGGGRAGNGGEAQGPSGAGGGGYSGGGGGVYGASELDPKEADGGDGGTVTGSVGSGGDAFIDIDSYTTYMIASGVSARGGPGGAQGDAGLLGNVTEGPIGGGGGAGYSGGGGAGRGANDRTPGVPGVPGDVIGPVGDGGHARIILAGNRPTVTASTDIHVLGGSGGAKAAEPPKDPLWGETANRTTINGTEHLFIPMSEPLLAQRYNEGVLHQLPVLWWTAVHDSTTNGAVVDYLVEVSTDQQFGFIELSSRDPLPVLALSDLSFGLYYWRVTAVYSEPIHQYGPPSMTSQFKFFNAAPVFQIWDPLQVDERRETVLNLTRYITDPDTHRANITLDSESPAVLSIDNLSITVLFEEPVDLAWIAFTLDDGHSRRAFHLPITVRNVNDPPVIVSIGGLTPPVTLLVEEGSFQWFDVVVEDLDGDKPRMDLFSTWRGIYLTADGSLGVRAQYERLGQFKARLEAVDNQRALAFAEITIVVYNVDDPPGNIEVYAPRDQSVHKELDSILFMVKVNDPDIIWGDVLWITWTSNISGQLMTTSTTDIATFYINDLPVGNHRITINVTDMEYVKSTHIDITVVERTTTQDPEPEVPGGIPPYIIVLLVIMPMLGYYIGVKGVLYDKRD